MPFLLLFFSDGNEHLPLRRDRYSVAMDNFMSASVEGIVGEEMGRVTPSKRRSRCR